MIHKHFKTKTKFNEELAKNPSGISDSDICFIKDTGEIWTHGKLYAGSDALEENKADKSETVSTVEYDTDNKKLTKTIDGTTTDIVTVATIKTDLSLSKSDVGLDNVGNFKAVSTVASQGLTSTEKSNARANIGAGTSSLTLGNGASNAYYGDKGKTAYDHSQAAHARTDATLVEASETNGNIKINGTETNVYTLPSSDPYTSERTPASHTHGNIANGGTLTDTAAAAAGNDYVVIRDASDNKIQTSTIKGTDVADAVSKKHSHSTITLSTSAQAYDGTHTIALPSSDPYSSARTPASHTHGNITNDGKITSTAVTSATGVLVYDSSNKIQRVTAANLRGIIGAGTSSLTLGEGATNAYYGDKGKTAYDHSQATHARTDATNTDVSYDTTNKKITKTINGEDSDVVTASDIVTDGGGIKSHATHKLNATNGTASAVSQGTEITYVESVAGTTTATSGNLSVSTTRKKITVPSAAENGTFSIKTKVGSADAVTAADFTANQSSADDITLIQGSNVTLTTDTTNRTVTVAATDTTYTFAGGTNKFTFTPLGGSAQSVTVTPSITRNVTGAAAWTAANVITTTNASSGNVIKASGVSISTTAPSGDSADTTVPTSKAVWTAISNGIAANDAMVYKGTIAGGSTGAYGALTGAADMGWAYKVSTAGKINGVAVEVGDLLICNADSTAAATSSNYSTIAANWDVIQTNVDGALFKSSNTFTDGHVLVADSTAGKVKDSGYTIGKSVPSNAVFTDASVTAVGNHYSPSADSNSELTASLSGTAGTFATNTEYTVLTGVKAQRDAKGHVTGLTYTAQKVKDTTIANTDRYVNSASFADNTSSSTDNPVKMTLTRAGSDSATVTANIPKVSSTSAGVAPKGATVSSQSQSTKFLREDGTWAAPSYTTNTNTTYTFANGTNGFTVTPSGGSAQTVTVTPSITNNVTASGNFAANAIIVGNAANQVAKNSGVSISTTSPLGSTSDTTVPTSKAVNTAITGSYVANLQPASAANYITEPEFKSVKINGSSTNSASSSNCQIQFDTTENCLKFIFN